MANDFQLIGQKSSALFTLKIHRGDGMALLAMNWKQDEPPDNFVGFAIESKQPGGSKFFPLTNRINFPGPGGKVDPKPHSSLKSPIQKFRWVHFPRNAELPGDFTYQVTPVFMDDKDKLSYGEPQEAALELRRETYPGQLNVAYTRGFISSQAFVEKYKTVSQLLPPTTKGSLDFVPTHPKAQEALAWMGFEARQVILEVLDKAIADPQAEVRMVAYDLNLAEVVERLEKLGSRLKIIIDDDGAHGVKGSCENEAQKRLSASAGTENVKRQHLGKLQHNKFIAVSSPNLQLAVCGSTNFSWRGFFVQSNNAVVVQGESGVAPFLAAFDSYWKSDKVADFGASPSANWVSPGLSGIDAKISFSPHSKWNMLLKSVADDIEKCTTSSLFYSLAFLYQTPGVIKNAIAKVTKDKQRFVYGISDRKVGGIVLQKPDGNLAPVFPAALSKNLPEPFKSEPTGGGGIRMHHKFVVIDFDKPTARVYLGSYNFSQPADVSNGENLLLITDRRIAVSYLVEALSIFDHYHFRASQQEAKKRKKTLQLSKPPRKPGEIPWWREYYTDAVKIRDRELFA